MQALNLPQYDARLRRLSSGQAQIYDCLRQKFVALTPEEWVRQHFVKFLITRREYPATLMANEVGIKHNGCQRRCDTIIYDRYAAPLAIVEYKAPDVDITPAVFDQIARYNMVLGVGCLMVSNGLKHYCCRVTPPTYSFLRDIPAYTSLLGDRQ